MQLAEAGKILKTAGRGYWADNPEGFVKHQSAFAVVEADLGQVTVAGADGSKRVVANILQALKQPVLCSRRLRYLTASP